MSTLRRKNRVVDEAFLLSLEALDLYIRKIMSGRFGGTRRSYGAGSSCEFLDYRDYVLGDDLRTIDWNLFGRLGKYYVKRYTDERQQETVVYLDASRSMAEDASGQKALTALRLAAAVGYLSVQSMDRVSFRLLREGACFDLCGSVMGREGFYRAGEALESVAFAGEVQLGAAIRADPAPGYDNGLSVIISDFLTDSNWKSGVDYLLSRKRQAALLHLVTPEEAAPRYRGPASLLDCEASLENDRRHLRLSIDRIALKAYQETFTAFQQDMRSFCVSRDAALLTVRTDRPLSEAFIRNGLQEELLR